MTCSSCGNANAEGARFCGICGKAICPQCGTAVVGSPVFCSVCGYRLNEKEKVKPDSTTNVLPEEDRWEPFSGGKETAEKEAKAAARPAGQKAHRSAAKAREAVQPETSKAEQTAAEIPKHRNRFLKPVALSLAILLGIAGIALLQVHSRTQVIGTTGTENAVPMEPAGSAKDNHVVGHGAKEQKEQKEQLKAAPTGNVIVRSPVNYTGPALVAFLLSLICFAVARPGEGHAPHALEASSVALRWGVAALPVILLLGAGLYLHLGLQPSEAAVLYYGAFALAIFAATLSAPAPSKGGEGGEHADYTSGRVSNFNARTESQGESSQTIWTWILETFDENGNSLPPAPVEMRSHSISGFLSEGNVIEIPAAYQAGELLKPDKVFNRTTKSWVVAKTSHGNKVGIIWLLLFPFITFPILLSS